MLEPSLLVLAVSALTVLARWAARWQRERHRHREMMKLLVQDSELPLDVPAAIAALQHAASVGDRTHEAEVG